MAILLKRRREARALNLGEQFLASLTAALALATVALAIAGSARAGVLVALPGDGPYLRQPAAAISHAESGPILPAAPAAEGD